jgi:hypothetical protein
MALVLNFLSGTDAAAHHEYIASAVFPGTIRFPLALAYLLTLAWGHVCRGYVCNLIFPHKKISQKRHKLAFLAAGVYGNAGAGSQLPDAVKEGGDF